MSNVKSMVTWIVDKQGRVTRWLVTRRVGRWVRLGDAEYAKPRLPEKYEEVELVDWSGKPPDPQDSQGPLREIEGLLSSPMGDGQRSPQVASRMDRALEIARVAQGKNPGP